MATNYVKFFRGSALAFQNLVTKNGDTLYFITDSDSNKSQLYLGDKLIAGGITEFSDLNDIAISDTLADGQLLTFDADQGKWINKGIIDAIGLMTGASATAQGGAGLVPAPGINAQDKFLRGDGNWVSIDTGSYYYGDDKTIESDGTFFSLKDFGKKYYAYIPESGSEEEGNYVAGHYEACNVDDVHPWKADLEPKVVEEDGELVLGWFEPNPTMLDGVVDSLTSLQNQIDGVNSTISSLEQTLTSVDNALTAEVAKKADKNNVYTKEETNSKINELISAAQHLVRKVFESLEEAEAFAAEVTNPADYVYMVKNTSETASDKYTEYLYIDEILEPVGSWDVDLDAYATKNELTVGLLGKVDAEEGKSLISEEDLAKLVGIEAGAEINFISSVDEAIFNVNEGKLEFKSISIDKVDELENLLNDKASVSSVNELIADVSDIEGNIVNLSNSITTIEEDITGLEGSISDLTTMLNSYVKQDAFEAKMTLVDNDLEQLKEALTWVSLDAQN